VTKQSDLPAASAFDETANVICECVNVVGANIDRFFTFVVTTLIGNPNAVACIDESANLSKPCSPELWESMQEKGYRSVSRTSLNYMQRNTIRRDEVMFVVTVHGDEKVPAEKPNVHSEGRAPACWRPSLSTVGLDDKLTP